MTPPRSRFFDLMSGGLPPSDEPPVPPADDCGGDGDPLDDDFDKPEPAAYQPGDVAQPMAVAAAGGRKFPIEPAPLANFRVVGTDEKTKRPIRVGLPPQDIHRQLDGITGRWPRREGDTLFVPGPDQRPVWLTAAESLFGWYSATAGRPDGTPPVEWAAGLGLMPKAEFFEYLRQSARAYQAVESAPHEPAFPDRFYLHPPAEGGDGAALAKLLGRFRPATPVDADLIRAFFLTLVWGGPPGSRPAFLFTAEDGEADGGRGVGKSTVARFGASLVGGYVSVSANDDMNKVKTRLLSPDALGCRVLLLDNLKTAKFSWAEFEALVTDEVISGHRLYAGEGRRPNTLVIAITLNGVSLSKDVAQRVIPIRLARPAFDPTWEETTAALVRDFRPAILGDLIAALRCPPNPLGQVSRWGTWERHVLSRVGDPGACQAVIRGRQAEMDEDADEAARVRETFAAVIRDANRSPVTGAFAFDSAAVVELVTQARGEPHSATRASSFLKTIPVPELRKSKIDGMRLWCWTGRESNAVQFERVAYNRSDRQFRFGTLFA